MCSSDGQIYGMAYLLRGSGTVKLIWDELPKQAFVIHVGRRS